MAQDIDRSGTPLVEMRDMQKAFGGIRAVDHVTIDLYPGEVVGVAFRPIWGANIIESCISLDKCSSLCPKGRFFGGIVAIHVDDSIT